MTATVSREPRWATFLCLLGVLCSLITPAVMVKLHDFKTCHDSGFCRRNREYVNGANALGSSWETPYTILPDSATFSNGQLQAVISKSINDNTNTVRLPITIAFHKSGTARVTVDEETRLKGDIELRHGSTARKERYNEVEKLVIVGGTTLDDASSIAYQDNTQMTIKYGPSSKYEAVVKYAPFAIDFKRDGMSQIKFNDKGWMNVEHWRVKVDKAEPEKKDGDENTEKSEGEEEPKEESPAQESEQDKKDDESTWWEESFGGKSDSKPRGPESVALDISFVGFDHVYGIPSHAGPLALKETRGGDGNYAEPYRLYNLDVFEYILDSPMTLYGSIPFMQAHRKGSSVGVFWMNAAETWIDITKSKSSVNPLALGAAAKTNTHTHWISESGLLDVFVFLGPTPKDLTKDFGELTGYTAMPQEFAIGYHQCRWNYYSVQDVLDVDRKMDRHQIPYDVIWLDIEYTDEKKYFTFNPESFKDPIAMGQKLDNHGRKLVTIIDPHIKNVDGYSVSADLKSKDLAVHDKDGNTYVGHCWPGDSSWADCFNPAAVEWWKSLFKYESFKGTMENTFVWNDMNEPSVFNGPEITMPKDNLHYGKWEHRDVHNLMGMTFHNATYQALLSRKSGEHRRPFVLTRAFYAGSQRYGAMWTGDNQASWEHLGAAIPMILSQGISGFPFSGADVGGFFGNPDKDLLARWYQAGAFYPFFRGHAHIDTRRREPYLIGDPYTGIITAALRLRYSLLPSWYTAFFHAHRDGSPIVRPMFWTHPEDEGGLDVDDQLFVGSTGLLTKPVVLKDQESVDIYIPDDEVYYDYFTYEVAPTHKGKRVTRTATLDQIPLLMRGGHIFPRRDTPRRSSALMRYDDYTLVVTIPRSGNAEGELYVDDGDSFDYEKGQYIHRRFSLAGNTLSSAEAEGREPKSSKPGKWMANMREVYVDKVVIVGASVAWDKKEVEISSEGKKWNVGVTYHKAEKGRAPFAVVGRVGARIGEDWSIKAA